jgi:putative DNA primase/helicase
MSAVITSRERSVYKLDAVIASGTKPSPLNKPSIQISAKSEWPKLLPLPEPEIGKAEKFPLEALGPVAGIAAIAVSRDVQAPDALAASSILATAALATQSLAMVKMPHGQVAPLSLYVISAVGSGDRKSATDSVATHPVEEYRRKQGREHAQRLIEHSARIGDKDAKPPIAQALIVSKATVEGLHSILGTQSHVGLFSSEGGELLGGHSLREERRSAGLSWYLKAWGGETLDALTRGDGMSLRLGRRVSMHAMVQPVLMQSLMADPLAQGQGFLARCLASQPSSIAGTRIFRAVDPMIDSGVKTYQAAVKTLLEQPPKFHEHGDGFELCPRVLSMSNAAVTLWVKFYDEIERLQANGNALSGARAFASRAAEHAARIAGVLTILGDASAGHIASETMEGAIEVARFYMGEHVRLAGTSMANERLSLLCSLLNFLISKRSIAITDVLRYAPNQVRKLKAEGTKELINELVDRGYVRIQGGHYFARSGV